MSEAQNFYQVLGLSRDATPDQIKKAYRKLARKYHPDVSKEHDAEAQMQAINVAYDTLMDTEKKQAYDFELDHPQAAGFGQRGQSSGQQYSYDQSHQSQAGADFSGFEDLFGRFGAGFGGTHQQGYKQHAYRGEDQHAKIEVDVQVAYEGAKQQFVLQIPSYTTQGTIEVQRKTLEVNIPKGLAQGQQIRLSGQGQQGLNGAANGDLYLEIVYRSTEQLWVEGSDVYFKVNVSPWEVGLSEKIQLQAPVGKIEVTIPAQAKNGQQLRLKGQGIPSKTQGHLYLILNVVTPSAQNAAQKQAYQQLAESFQHFNPRHAH